MGNSPALGWGSSTCQGPGAGRPVISLLVSLPKLLVLSAREHWGPTASTHVKPVQLHSCLGALREILFKERTTKFENYQSRPVTPFSSGRKAEGTCPKQNKQTPGPHWEPRTLGPRLLLLPPACGTQAAW